MRVSPWKTTLVSLAAILTATVVGGPAMADGPGVGTPSLVSLGDSTISGEAGRWAGNTNEDSKRVDALGATAYFDATSGETIPGCHRSGAAEVHIERSMSAVRTALPVVNTMNLACSGAETSSYIWDYGLLGGGPRFKPGLDTACPPELPIPTTATWTYPQWLGVAAAVCPRKGQLVSLYDYATTHNVKAVVVAVGANDFDFSGVIQQCMKLWIFDQIMSLDSTCSHDPAFTDPISAANQKAHAEEIFTSLSSLAYVMEWAGYDRSDYTVILQNYWSALPQGSLRYHDTMERQTKGGCGLHDRDAFAMHTELLEAINDTVLVAAAKFRAEPYFPALRLMDVSAALAGHRLCEKGVGLLEETGSSMEGYQPAMVDKVEWVQQMDTVSTLSGPYALAEGGHANYWGQLAERNCLRQMWSNGVSRDGRCVPAAGGGVNQYGEPNMTLQR